MAEKKKQEVSEALKAEEKLESEWYVMDLDGKLHKLDAVGGKISGFDFKKYPNLLKFAQYEIGKKRAYEKEPPHIELMKKLEMVDYEKGSDLGQFRYFPRGRFVKKMIERFVSDEVAEYGGMEIESPVMYDYEHPSLKKYMHRFPARQYIVESSGKRSFFLRFAACFGQFLMAHDMNISYKHLPLRLYELAKSFRLEQSGELAGLKRLRAFSMPDCHAFVKDYEQGQEEMIRRFDLSQGILEGLGFEMPNDFELGIRLVKEFNDENSSLAKELVKNWGKPALVEMWDKRFFYFSMKYELNFIDAMDKASALVTDQFDVENAERYGIYYIDKDNKKKHPIILHLSPSGGIERVMYALWEREWMREQQKKAGMLPVWMSPEQIRILPIADRHKEFADKIAEQLEDECIRVSIDDRDLSIPKKVFQAKMAWVPYIIVVGDKEMESKELPVVIREESEVDKDKKENMDVKALIDRINKEVEGMPVGILPVPKYVSQQPIFFARK